MQASLVVDQLLRLRKRHPESPLVVFVPRTQVGRSIETALARCQRGWEGVQTVIPRHYAEDVARTDIFLSGKKEAPVGAQLFRAARTVQDLPDEEKSGTLPGWHLLANTVAGVIDRLREDDVSVQEIKERVEEAGSSQTLGVISACYEYYVQELEEKKLYDDADVYQWATERVTSGNAPQVSGTVYGALGAADLSEHAFQFLSVLRNRGLDFVRLGSKTRLEPPPETAAARFEGTRSLAPQEAHSSNEEGGLDRFVRAVGAKGEVRSALRNLLRDEVAFGNAVIAYTDSQPYASLLVDEAERAGIPLTMGTGLPAEYTRTGRALRDLYEWVREDYDPVILIRMLRSGLLRTDRWMAAQEDEEEPDGLPSFRAHEAATLLAERSYEPGREGLLKGLSAAVGEMEEKGDLTNREERHLDQRRMLRSFVEDLTDLIPRQGEIQEMAQNSCQFLQQFGPTDATEKEEEERTPDEAARGLLYKRLQRLSGIDVSCEAGSRQLASLFQQWLKGQYVQAESPRPGHVHVLPLESAGYSDRPDLHVVGLDSTTFAAAGSGNGMLQETDRRALVSSLERADEGGRRTTPSDEELWQASKALERHQGQVTCYTRIFDIESGEERDPSSLFLQRERLTSTPDSTRTPTDTNGHVETKSESDKRKGQERKAEEDQDVVGLVSDADAPPLSEGDLWLRASQADYEESDSPPEETEINSARALLHEKYPWVLAGEEARQARRSGAYTVHDGLLSPGVYSDLDFFGTDAPPLSASRLQTLAEAPYVYFLKYVLGARPLEEPALDDEPWLNRLRKGTLLHEIYERFMRRLDEDGEVPTPDDDSRIDDIVDEVLEEETEAFAPPSPVIEESARRELRQNAAVFLQSEIERSGEYTAERFELGFGFPPHRREDQDIEQAARLSVADRVLPLRGRVDRIDRNPATGGLAAWDYKTGSASSYDEEDPLQDGKTLQWALYAYALESLPDEELQLDGPVEESGYFFANTKEVGARISAHPAQHREEAEKILQQLGELVESGSFPVTPDLKDANDWKWGGYDRLVSDLGSRKKELKDKDYPADRPEPPSF